MSRARSRARVGRRRLLASLVLAALAAATAGAVVLATSASVAQQTAPPLRYEGWAAATGLRMLGGAAQAGPAEAWAFDTDAAKAAVVKPFLQRYRREEGWQPVEVGLDEAGQPYDGGSVRDGRVTARGGLLLVADDDRRPSGEQQVVMIRDPDTPVRVLAAPPAGTLLPAQGSTPAETLSQSAVAARDVGGKTEAYLGIAGRLLETGVARWGDGAWTREPLCATDGVARPAPACQPSETLTVTSLDMKIVAIAAAEDGGAWALAKTGSTDRRGLVLFERTVSRGDPRWVLHELPTPLFADAATPSRTVDSVAPLGLTPSAAGVWLDGTFRFRADSRDVTLFLDSGGAATTWCDGADATGALCDHPLGIRLTGSRSQAWAAGGPYGSRAIGLANSDYATLEGDVFVPRGTFASAGARFAFAAPDEGWISSVANAVHVTRDTRTSPIASWSVPVRHPLAAVAGEPGKPPGDLAAQALAVGADGDIVRYTPGQGWDSEALLTAGGVATPDLRGVAWPQQDFAYAVGEDGAMWRWRRVTGLWEPDPAAPFDFVSQLLGIAFQPGKPDRGYVVGRSGTLLRYGKSWEQEPLPPEVPPGTDLLSIAFAGQQALVAAGRRLLVNDGSGWRVDTDAQRLIDAAGAGATIIAVAGLPDGGAVAAGAGLVLVRDSASGPWRTTASAPAGTAFAAAATRDGGSVRALVSVAPTGQYPSLAESDPPFDPNAPPPRPPMFSFPGDGYVLKETATGWEDEQRSQLTSPTQTDLSRKADPVLAMLVGPSGGGWLVGGWNSKNDSTGHGVDFGQYPPDAAQVTASVSRFDPAGAVGSANVRPAPVATPSGPVRLLVGGGARCKGACAQLGPIDIGPDRMLTSALAFAGRLNAEPNGPRALLYTGGRAAVAGLSEQQRFAELLATAPLPVLPAIADGEAIGGRSLDYEQAFSGFPAPLGSGAAPAGMTPVALGQPAASGRARTHFAVDSAGADGTVRIVVIDNATGSLAARDGTGNPVESQADWLRDVLADAKGRGIASIVVGNRSLDASVRGGASDGNQVAAILRDGGASAYLYERGGLNRVSTVPVGSGEVPAFGTGTLGYRTIQGEGSDDDTSGLLMLELDLARRDRTTGRAPVSVRLLPVIEDLALDAIDGRVVERSEPVLFKGLGRRPRSGAASGPYLNLPLDPCRGSVRCPDRIDPEVRFTSSDPDIADFVQVDRSSPNPRKPLLDTRTDKTIPDATSGLLCAFNAGTTTVTIESGGLAYSTSVTVRDGSVLRPCGTMPLDPRRFPRAPPPRTAVPAATPPPADDPPDDPPPTIPPPPPPASVEQPVVAPPSAESAPSPQRPQPRAERAPEPNPVPAAPALPGLVPLAPLPPPPSVARPIPPSGTAPVPVSTPVMQPVAQVERQREEEEALEQSQAYARVSADHEPGRVAAPLLVLILLAATGAGAIRRPRRDRSYAYADDRYRRSRR